jgi:hypothetical protein
MTCVSNGFKEVVLEVSGPHVQQWPAVMVSGPTLVAVFVMLQDLDCVRFLGDICRYNDYTIVITEPTLATVRLTVRRRVWYTVGCAGWPLMVVAAVPCRWR